jgi:hypothetical protein
LNEQVERDRAWEVEEIARQRAAMKAGEREELWERLHPLLADVAANAQALSADTLRWSQAVAATQAESAQ